MEKLEKLIAVQQGLNAPKDKRNTFGGYNYRSCESILEAVKPLLKEQQLALTISDDIVALGNRVYVKATAKVIDIKGDVIAECTAFAREEEDKKGMDAAQLTGATSSYARKYALNGLFAIDDSKDADTDEFQKEQKAKKEPAKPAAQPKPAEKKPAPAPAAQSQPKTYPLPPLSDEENEQYLGFMSDISSADTIAAIEANVTLAIGQKFEDAVRRAAAKKGIAIATNRDELNHAYEFIKDREGWQEIKIIAMQTAVQKGFATKKPANAA